MYTWEFLFRHTSMWSCSLVCRICVIHMLYILIWFFVRLYDECSSADNRPRTHSCPIEGIKKELGPRTAPAGSYEDQHSLFDDGTPPTRPRPRFRPPLPRFLRRWLILLSKYVLRFYLFTLLFSLSSTSSLLSHLSLFCLLLILFPLSSFFHLIFFSCVLKSFFLLLLLFLYSFFS